MIDPVLSARLEAIVRADSNTMALLEFLARIERTPWCLGAGFLAGRVWNHLTGRPPGHGVKDLDIAIFDAADLSVAREATLAAQLETAFPDIGLPIDVKNQARVHLWYEERFERPIAPFANLEEALSTWPTSVNALGVSLVSGEISTIAPFGLEDLFAMKVRPNKRQVTKDVYYTKVARWKACWPELDIADW